MGEGVRIQGLSIKVNTHRQLARTRVSSRKVRVMKAQEAKDKAKHDTERGLNAREIATLAKLENKNAQRKTEQINIVDANGNVVYTNNGSKNHVGVDAIGAVFAQDNVITHNHPAQTRKGVNLLGNGIASRIGLPLNGTDVSSAMRNNAKEVRASAQGYVFSVKRPNGGWKGTPEQVEKAFRYYWQRPTISLQDYALGTHLRTPLDKDTQLNRQGRWNVATQNAIMRQLSKDFGFTYTRRRLK